VIPTPKISTRLPIFALAAPQVPVITDIGLALSPLIAGKASDVGGRGYQPLQPPPPLFSRPDSLNRTEQRQRPSTAPWKAVAEALPSTTNLFQGPVPASSQIAACAAQRHLTTGSRLSSSPPPPPNRTVFPSPANSPELRSPARVQVFALPSLPVVPLAKYPSNLCHGAPALSSQSLTDIHTPVTRSCWSPVFQDSHLLPPRPTPPSSLRHLHSFLKNSTAS